MVRYEILLQFKENTKSGCFLMESGEIWNLGRSRRAVSLFFLFFIFYFFYLYWILSYIEMKQPWVYMCSPSRSPRPPPSPPAPSRSSQCTRSKRLSHASNLGWWSVFTLDTIHVSMLFSWNIPPSPSPTESKRLFYKSVSFFFFSVLHIGLSLTSF